MEHNPAAIGTICAYSLAVENLRSYLKAIVLMIDAASENKEDRETLYDEMTALAYLASEYAEKVCKASQEWPN